MLRRTRWERGYTLVEALVLVGLIGAILAVALPAFYRMLQAYRIQMAAQQITTSLRFARNAAVKQKMQYQVTFDSGADNYRIEYNVSRSSPPSFVDYPHPGCTSLLSDTRTCTLPPKIDIKSGGLSSVIFDSRGAASTSGNIDLVGTDLAEYRVSLAITGAVTTTKTREGIY